MSSTPQASGEAKVSALCPFGAFESEHDDGACPCFPGVVLAPGEDAAPHIIPWRPRSDMAT